MELRDGEQRKRKARTARGNDDLVGDDESQPKRAKVGEVAEGCQHIVEGTKRKLDALGRSGQRENARAKEHGEAVEIAKAVVGSGNIADAAVGQNLSGAKPKI